MDIREALLAEHSKRQVLRIAAYIGDDSKRFAKLMELFLGDHYRTTQRAAWALMWTTHRHPQLLRPWIGKMVRNLRRPGLHVAVKRNTMRVLDEAAIPVAVQGELVETAFRFLKDEQETVAVRVFAMSVLANICRQQPELKNELKPIIEQLMPYGSAAIRARGRKVLKELEKL